MPADLAKPAFDLGIVTTQIDSALGFYRDIVGLVPVMMLARETGDIHLLAAGERLLKLVDAPDAPSHASGAITDASGLRYVSFWITNLDEVHDELVAASIDILKPPFEVAPSTRAMLVHDPDGNVVEFLEEAT
jgi:catechol-2,3-dioxygenase